MEERVRMEVEVHVPHLLLYEVASAILKSILMGAVRLSDGGEALEALGHLGMKVYTTGWRDLREILEIAAVTKLTVYGLIYLHLARRIGAQLITADSHLKRRGEKVAEIVLLKDLGSAKS